MTAITFSLLLVIGRVINIITTIIIIAATPITITADTSMGSNSIISLPPFTNNRLNGFWNVVKKTLAYKLAIIIDLL